jgi:hypothetical protein
MFPYCSRPQVLKRMGLPEEKIQGDELLRIDEQKQSVCSACRQAPPSFVNATAYGRCVCCILSSDVDGAMQIRFKELVAGRLKAPRWLGHAELALAAPERRVRSRLRI